MADDPVKGVQEPEYVREKEAIPSLGYGKEALLVADEDLALWAHLVAGRGDWRWPGRATEAGERLTETAARTVHAAALGAWGRDPESAEVFATAEEPCVREAKALRTSRRSPVQHPGAPEWANPPRRPATVARGSEQGMPGNARPRP
ncbi:hypothetical protein [Streptomyces sp. NBC_00094]|uniref:hypothetical protein n=1 Tax=Streptomyces sp. NBC_00094 TaxID=2903620 RepID=UPI00225BAA1E|nr:hypothetical protein [Streptomyces sp. NBC_00094]MCX5394556.1 hypothetical protein [Streptomyces sp. NBC_00094]